MNTTPTFSESLSAWKWAVSGTKNGAWPQEIIAPTRAEFDEWTKEMWRTQKAAQLIGLTCQFNKGAIKNGKAGVWISSNGHTLKVVFDAKAKRPQAVTATSINAYHSIDLATAQGNVAAAIFTYSRLGKDVTRKELEVWQKIASSSVCGRVKELLDLSEIHPFLFEGKPYRLQRTVARVSLCHGASDKVNEGLMWVEVISQPERAQLEMF